MLSKIISLQNFFFPIFHLRRAYPIIFNGLQQGSTREEGTAVGNQPELFRVQQKLFLKYFILLVETENRFPCLQSSDLALFTQPLKIYFPDLHILHLPFKKNVFLSPYLNKVGISLISDSDSTNLLLQA